VINVIQIPGVQGFEVDRPCLTMAPQQGIRNDELSEFRNVFEGT
jgi:hypothetical protein